MEEVIEEFLVESYENLDNLDQELVRLETEPNNREILASIFRTIHTIKGTCGFLGYGRLESVTHAGETLLSKLRDGLLIMTPETTTGLLQMVDAVRALLQSIEANGEEQELDFSDLVTKLAALSNGETPETTNETIDEPAPTLASDAQIPDASEGVSAADSHDDETALVGEFLVDAGAVEPDAVTLALQDQQLETGRKLGEILVDHGATDAGSVEDALLRQQETRTSNTSVSDSSIRVDVKLLDSLMTLVGELVLARNQLLQISPTTSDDALHTTSQRLNNLTTELQDAVMQTRLQQIGTVWNKFPRIVRDLANQCEKEVTLDMEGVETELDKTLIEAIKDPMTHIVRNSVDHGIESPDERQGKGKPRHGTLRLKAFHQSGQVNIEIVDDGAGIDPDKVARKALEKGVVTPERLDRMSDREITNLIFAPGFSTAEKVSNLSGRGVGMDVVKTSIEKVGGSIELSSQVGVGTTICMRIPLTLAIIPALTVVCREQRYAIPQVSVGELVRLTPSDIEYIQGAPVYRLRDKLLPLVRLDEQLGFEIAGHQDDVTVAVLQANGRQFGLVVDAVMNTEEIVVKPLAPQLRDIPAYAGATVMGDGRVALILDASGLASMAGINSIEDKVGDAEQRNDSELGDQVLLVSVGVDTPVAIPLADVERLEEFDTQSIEISNHREVVQYRGSILPLVRLAQRIDVEDTTDRQHISVVIHKLGDQEFGLVINRILDVVDDSRVTATDNNSCIAGTSVIRGRVTDVIDVARLFADQFTTEGAQ